ncbi:response regulator transcription factor [Chloroflexi bacterium TSY]|nr:response regulator transcription factor [Chloroflexi bacterium TSY]
MNLSRIRVLLVNEHQPVISKLSCILNPYDDIYLSTALVSENRLKQQMLLPLPHIFIIYAEPLNYNREEFALLIQQLSECGRVLVLLDRVCPLQFVPVFKCKASSLMFTDEVQDSIVYIIRAIYAGETWVSAGIARMQQQIILRFQFFYVTLKFTTQETAILMYLMDGMKTSEIGKSLYIANSTVRNYVSKIYKKLKVSSRTEMMSKLKTYGIYSTDDLYKYMNV